MSRLDELIKEYCPDGIDYIKIGDVVNYEQPTKYIVSNTDYDDSFDTPVLTAGQTFILGYTNEKENIYSASKDKPVIIFDDFTGAFKWVDFPFKVKSSAMKILTANEEKTTTRYIFHIMGFLNYTSDEHKRLWISIYSELEIPLPPIEVQREIVKILDEYTASVTALQQELEAELTARRKQYEYYRDKLLSFDVHGGGADEVEWRTLREVATSIYRGSGITRDQVTETGIQCVRYGEIYTTYNTWFDKCVSHTDENSIQNPKYFEHGDILFAITGESVEDIAKSVAYIGKEKCLAGGDIVVLKHNQNPRYLAHALSTYDARKQKSKGKIKSKVVHSSVPSIESIRIPVPSLEIQARIADVLDNFEKICSDLSIGLPAEIEARQKQYEYYRDALLSFDNSYFINVERERESCTWRSGLIKLWQYVFGSAKIKIGDIGKICMCKRIMKSETAEQGDIPFYKIGTFGGQANAYISMETYEKYKSQYSFPKKGDILISAAGTIGRTVIYDGEPAYYQDSNIVWVDNNEKIVLNKYLYYCYQLNPWSISTGGTIARLYNDNISNAVITIPPLAEQKNIISILDRFNSLCNDISEGLPAEIEARQKQYEYYRDKLLSFKEL